MIKADDIGVYSSGNSADLTFELAHIISAVRETFEREYGEEFTGLIISLCGELAYTNDNDVEKVMKRYSEEVKKIAIQDNTLL